MRLYICNAFSLSMLDRGEQLGTPTGYVPCRADKPMATARIPRPIDDPSSVLWSYDAVNADIISAVGHSDTAAVFSRILKYPVSVRRMAIRLGHGDSALIGQVVSKDGGPYRLPEGAVELPEDAVIEWWMV